MSLARLVRQSPPEEHRSSSDHAFLPVVTRVSEQSILSLGHRPGPGRRCTSGIVLTGYVHDHIVEIRKKLRIEQRKDPLVELPRVTSGHHVVIPRGIRSIEIAEHPLPSAEIVQTIRAAAAVVLEADRRVGQGCLGVVVPPPIIARSLPGSEKLERPLASHTLVRIFFVPGQLAKLMGVFVVVTVVGFREVGGRGRRRAGTRRVLRQASDGPVSSSISYVRLLHLLYGFVLSGRVGILAVRVLRRHVQHQVDGFIIKTG